MASGELFEETTLADLLTGTVKAIAQAQAALDENRRTAVFADAPGGALVLPPVCLAIQSATIEVEMSAAIAEQSLRCRLLNPNQVALFGYQASSGLRVRLTVGNEAIPGGGGR